MACGSSQSGPGFGSSSNGGAEASGSFGAASGTSGKGSGGQFGDDGGASGDALPNGACAQAIVKTKVIPALLAFMFDRSGSMTDSVGGGLTKWTALTPALEAFFGDPRSAGLSASLQFFPQSAECTVSAYAAALVPMTALPAGAVFTNPITATAPTGDTPTLPALEGAFQYAAQEQAQNPGANVAVVLVTDGEPHDSCGSTVATVAAAAQQHAAQVPTYVIGIGKKLTSLDMIAQAGGTKQAFLVSTTNYPEAGAGVSQTESDFVNALASIRSSQGSCRVPIPSPPTGQTLDFHKINVLRSSNNGQPETLTYDPGCGAAAGSGSGWHYDNQQNPTAIVLCPDSCTAIQTDATSQLSVELGCVTVGLQ
jgi:hypothetical protein